MKKKILLTRPQESSLHWQQLLAARGFTCVIDPLMRIEPTRTPCPAGSYQATIVTSVNALRVLGAEKNNFFAMPCFCVGQTTGDAARADGFTNIHCGSSDSTGLAQLITATLADHTRPLLHLCGDITDGKAHEVLIKNGFAVTAWPVYSALAADNLSPETCAALATGVVGSIPVFSPRSARILVSLIVKNGLASACSYINTVALSQTVADVLQSLPWQRLRIAATPSEESVLACLEDIHA